MHVRLELDEKDKQAIARMAAECACWRLNRYFYLLVCLAFVGSASGQFMWAMLHDWPARQLFIGTIGMPIGIILCVQLYRRWHGPVWSHGANKLALATSPEA